MKGVAIGLILAAAVAMSAAEKTAVPRTRDGHPDLHGTWSYATLTTLERPAEFAGKVRKHGALEIELDAK